jgi:C4-dicarboxylate-specific signal transduction histidine kinase
MKEREAAEERLATIGRLIGGIAHDFNNLLCIIQLAIGSLTRRKAVAGDTAAGDLLGQVRLAAKDCADITAKLLSFARQDTLQPEALEMGQFLKDLRPLLAHRRARDRDAIGDSGAEPGCMGRSATAHDCVC